MKRFISLILTFSLLMCLSLNVFASEVVDPQKTNVNIISEDLDNIEYTYEQGGESYKVKENLSADYSKAETEIYKLNKSNEYVLVESYVTFFTLKDADTLLISKHQNGHIDTQELKLTELVMANETPGQNVSTRAAGQWELNNTHKGNTVFQNLTYSYVFGLIATVASSGLGPVPSTAIGTIVNLIISECIPILYYERMVYYYRVGPAQVTQVRVATNFYYNAMMTNYFKSAVVYYDGLFPW